PSAVYALSLPDALPIFTGALDVGELVQPVGGRGRLGVHHLALPVALVPVDRGDLTAELTGDVEVVPGHRQVARTEARRQCGEHRDRKSTRLNSSHVSIS